MDDSQPAKEGPTGFWPTVLDLLKGRYGPIILVAGLMWGGWQYMIVPLNKESRVDWQQQQTLLSQQQAMLNQQQAMLVQQAAIGVGMQSTASTMERIAEKLEDVSKRIGPGAFGGGAP